jgi:aryl-alcohol dehydrogenase-like predicted oxidoreductase
VLLGKYLLPAHRGRIILANKVHDRTAEGAKRQLDQSLANLKTDKIDILHFHDISTVDEVNRIMAPGGAYEALARAKEQGIIRFIGLSGHTSGAVLVEALRRIKPDLMMCPQNAARESGFTDMVIPFAQQNNIGLLGMKVTAQDALLGRGIPAEDLVRYSLSLPVSSMVIGISSLPVLESCVRVARTLKPFTPAEMMTLNGRLASLDTQRCFPYHRRGYRDGNCYA